MSGGFRRVIERDLRFTVCEVLGVLEPQPCFVPWFKNQSATVLQK